MKAILWTMILLAVAIGFIVPVVEAATPVPVGGPLGGDNFSGQPGIDLNAQRVFAIITGLACWFTRIALLLIVAALVIYGIQFLASRGNPAAMQAASRAFWLGIVGIIVILGAYAIVATIGNTITGDTVKYSNYVPISCN